MLTKPFFRFPMGAMIERTEKEFFDFAIGENILQFGSFTLKSGRQSPYFYNSGLFNTGEKLDRLGQFYAAAIVKNGLSPDVLFGPAYKGIPLLSATAIALARFQRFNLPYTFNRKEVKDHGEGGSLVGAPLNGKVLIVDDVISAGITIGESIELVRANGAEVLGVIIAFDRQEMGQHSKRSAVQEVRESFDVQVYSIARVTALIGYLQENQRDQDASRIKNYLRQYGA